MITKSCYFAGASSSSSSQNRTFHNSGKTSEKSTTSSPSPSPSPRSPLLRELLQRIQWSGPLTVAEYMKTALTHPRHGFYTASPEVFGSRGHFTTSPEVSALFGEMVAVWVLYEWQRRTANRKSPRPLRVVELGPGRGFLTADVARVLAQFAAKNSSGTPNQMVSFHLVEISDRLRAIQERNICGEKEASSSSKTPRTAHGQPISWHRSLEELLSVFAEEQEQEPKEDKVEQQPKQKPFTVFLANEYFDAFPVHKFVRSGSSSSGEQQQQSAWREVLVDMTPTGDALRLIQARHPTPASQYFTSASNEATDILKITGDHYEVCPGALLQTAAFVDQLTSQTADGGPGGALLIIDYGFDAEDNQKPPNRDTFRAFRAHALADPLAEPGAADLTADVDFAAIRAQLKAKSKKDVQVFGTVTQEHFLRQLGIGLRLQMLLAQNSSEHLKPEARQQLVASVRMLLEEMGRRFRVMAVFAGGGGSDQHGTPVGFEQEKEKEEEKKKV